MAVVGANSAGSSTGRKSSLEVTKKAAEVGIKVAKTTGKAAAEAGKSAGRAASETTKTVKQVPKGSQTPDVSQDQQNQGPSRAAQIAAQATDPEFVHGIACGDLSQLTKLCQSTSGWASRCQAQSQKAMAQKPSLGNTLRPGGREMQEIPALDATFTQRLAAQLGIDAAASCRKFDEKVQKGLDEINETERADRAERVAEESSQSASSAPDSAI